MNPEFNHSISFQSHVDGPRLIVLGAVHGNEICGTRAIEQIVAELHASKLAIKRGMVTFVPVTNPLAYKLKQRSGERNLNRMLMPYAEPAVFEDRLANWLCPLLAQHDVLLDLHSFQGTGMPFVMVGPENNTGALEPFRYAEEEKALAKILGVSRAVDGWLTTYERGILRRQSSDGIEGLPPQHIDFGVGTTEYMRRLGGYGVTLECGQHYDPHAVPVARKAIQNTLTHLGLIDNPKELVATKMESLRLYDVVDKLHDADHFSHDWSSFDPLKKNQLIGFRHDGSPVLTPLAGYIVFPDVSARRGDEWFYLARFSDRFA